MATKTEDYPLTSSRPSRSRTPALVIAYPISRAIPIPPATEAFGREQLGQLGIRDRQASSKHVVFTRPGGVLHVEDVGSRNGTWIDGAPIPRGKRVALPDGAVLRIGSTLLVVRDDFEGRWEPSPDLGEMVGPFGLREVASALEGVARGRPASVLVQGETGTGKELVARSAAAALGRERKYVAINIAGLAENVFESQVFGYVRGAFTSAGPGSPGILAAHAGGAVFLDEIGELPLALQAKLLRVVDQREVLPVGATAPVRVDVAIVAATNRSLAQMVEAGTFRRDLLARLAEWPIDLPPLRDRAEDVFAIAAALRERSNQPLDPASIDVEAVERLLLHAWPSNIRELRSVLGRAAVADPPGALRRATIEALLPEASAPARPILTEERVRAALEKTKSQVKAAEMLGVSRGMLRRFLERQ